jgi:hypothetical protein
MPHEKESDMTDLDAGTESILGPVGRKNPQSIQRAKELEAKPDWNQEDVLDSNFLEEDIYWIVEGSPLAVKQMAWNLCRFLQSPQRKQDRSHSKRAAGHRPRLPRRESEDAGA